MTKVLAVERSIILFGAFDRHNFGDLLLPHVTMALLPGHHFICAGLASRDLRPQGGHEVRALAHLAAEWGGRPATLTHVGGEILTCSAWQAAVMLLPPELVADTVAYLEARPLERVEWVRQQLGISALAPYTLTRTLFPGIEGVVYNGVGGVELDRSDPALQAEVLANLRAADDVAVRDRLTLARLVSAGIGASLIPDPVVMVAELFGARIRQRSHEGEVELIRRAFARGYVAVQFSAEFGDDETLSVVAAQLDKVVSTEGLGVALFRAGAAPWHDDLECLQRVATRMRTPSVKVFESLDIWDICALIAGSRAYCGSSLHGRIVAMAFALPRANLRHSALAKSCAKQDAFAGTWEDAGTCASVPVLQIAEAVHTALSEEPGQLRRTARRLVSDYRQGFNAMFRASEGPGAVTAGSGLRGGHRPSGHAPAP